MAIVNYTVEGVANEAYADSYKVCVQFGFAIPFQVLGLVAVLPDNKYCYTDDAYCIPAKFFNEDDERNGKNSFLFDFAAPILGGQNFIIQQFNGTSWNDIGFFDNTTGVLCDFGTWASYPNRSGFIVDWFMFQTLYGSGKFRLYVKNDPLATVGAYSPCFCVSEFNCKCDNLIRIEVITQSIQSNIWYKFGQNNEPRTFETNLMTATPLPNGNSVTGWYDSSFYRGFFGQTQFREKTVNEIAYNSNFVNRQYDLTQELYTFYVQSEQAERLRRLTHYGLKFDSVIAHDFNAINANTRYFRNVPIVFDTTGDIKYSNQFQIVPEHEFKVKNRIDIEYLNKR